MRILVYDFNSLHTAYQLLAAFKSAVAFVVARLSRHREYMRLGVCVQLGAWAKPNQVTMFNMEW